MLIKRSIDILLLLYVSSSNVCSYLTLVKGSKDTPFFTRGANFSCRMRRVEYSTPFFFFVSRSPDKLLF